MKKVTTQKQVDEIPIGTEVLGCFYCTRCSRNKFFAKAIIEKNGYKKVYRLSDGDVIWINEENESHLFCHRCTRAYYTFLRKY